MRFTALLLLAVASVGCKGTPTVSPPSTEAKVEEAKLVWGPAPPIFPRGAQMAVVEGNPGASAFFTVWFRFPDGYKIPPHTHPTDEVVTVISGTFLVGLGSTFELKSMARLHPGGFVTAPAGHAHFAAAQGQTIVQVHAMGPFGMTYVNPADTPPK